MPVNITPVQSGADKRAFYNFAWRVYRDDPNWVPHLWPQRKAYLDHKAAFFSYGEGAFWLARRGGEVVGTGDGSRLLGLRAGGDHVPGDGQGDPA